MDMFRIGQGIDAHAFAVGRKLVVGGVQIPFKKGLVGHSDADVLVHAIMDALLGAVAGGDIGVHFPDTDPLYKGADSLILLGKLFSKEIFTGWTISNIDSTIIAESPKFAPYISQMRDNISKVLIIPKVNISVKATTTEKLGFCGRGDGIAAMASVLLVK